jgi:hypothetical protein
VAALELLDHEVVSLVPSFMRVKLTRSIGAAGRGLTRNCARSAGRCQTANRPGVLLSGRERLSRRTISLIDLVRGGFGMPRNRSAMR